MTGRPRRLAMAGGLLAATVAGAVAAVALIGGAPAPAAPAAPRVATVRVARTNLVTTVLTEGTLGYGGTSPVVNELTGTFTQIPRPGRRIAAGGTLFRVDDLPVVLMTGRVPAWRPMLAGITGPDVTELDRNLIALGYASGLLGAPSSIFTPATSLAVERWQQAVGLPVTGQVGLGQVLFLPGPVLVGTTDVAPGDPATPGQVPYQVTTPTRVVTVPLDPANAPRVTLGQRVHIVLPSDAVTPGMITAMGPPSPPAGSGGPPGGATGGSQPSPATTVLTVTPLHPWRTGRGSGVPVQVSLTTQSATGVLAVPVSALLALQGGGYGLEVVEPSGAHRLVAVHTGIFAGSLVQVSGSGITAGTKVVVAQ